MVIVGEKLNSSIPSVLSMMDNRDEEKIVEIIKKQCYFGANYLDVNTAMTKNEESSMLWILDLIKKNSNVGVMLDSPSPSIIIKSLEYIKDTKVIINSVTMTDRLELIDVAKEYNTGIVALPIGSKFPRTLNERIENSYKMVDKLISAGIRQQDIYLDIIAEALSTDTDSALKAFKTIEGLKSNYANVNTICGISNVSFGLPSRFNINSTFLTIAIYTGLDCAILDITSKKIRDAIYSASAITGKDDYCLDYINYIRSECAD